MQFLKVTRRGFVAGAAWLLLSILRRDEAVARALEDASDGSGLAGPAMPVLRSEGGETLLCEDGAAIALVRHDG